MPERYFIDLEPDALQRLQADFPADEPVVVLHLQRFREQADYPAGAAQAPCSGIQAFNRYLQLFEPLLAEHHAQVLWRGSQAGMLIGPQDKQWHLVMLVRYPDAATLGQLLTSQAHRAAWPHRQAALADSRMIAHREG